MTTSINDLKSCWGQADDPDICVEVSCKSWVESCHTRLLPIWSHTAFRCWLWSRPGSIARFPDTERVNTSKELIANVSSITFILTNRIKHQLFKVNWRWFITADLPFAKLVCTAFCDQFITQTSIFQDTSDGPKCAQDFVATPNLWEFYWISVTNFKRENCNSWLSVLWLVPMASFTRVSDFQAGMCLSLLFDRCSWGCWVTTPVVTGFANWIDATVKKLHDHNWNLQPVSANDDQSTATNQTNHLKNCMFIILQLIKMTCLVPI